MSDISKEEQIDQAIATFQSAIILAEGNFHRGSTTFDEMLEIESAAVAKLKRELNDLKIMTTPHNSDTELEQLKEQLLKIDTVYIIGNNHTKEFLPPNFYIDRLADFIKQRETRLVAEAKRKGYQTGHQQGKTIATPRKSREYKGTKARSILTDFLERLPASSSRCDCLTCKEINRYYASLKQESEETNNE